MVVSQVNGVLPPGRGGQSGATLADLRGGPILESLLLSVSSFWAMRETNERQVELVERFFRKEEVLHAL